MIIIPSFLVQTEKQFIDQITAIQTAVPLVQLDIADGKFVPNTTWAEPNTVERYATIDVELHLMVKNPLQELKRWSATEQIKRVFVHYESVENLKDVLPTLHAYGWDIGIVLNADTPTKMLIPYLSEIQAVMFMGIIPGKQKQPFIPEVLEKIKEFSSQHPNVFTELDGGVNMQTLPDIIQTGVKAICPGSALFGNEKKPTENLIEIQSLINNLTE